MKLTSIVGAMAVAALVVRKLDVKSAKSLAPSCQ
jgi:hypothetical protein